METLGSIETADDSSGNSAAVKSEDGSPNHSNGRNSPPPNCAICLGRCRNKSFTDSCLHQFCFKCLLTWSRVKTECPLCKQNFKSIIHNVKSNHQYEEYRVQQPQSQERVLPSVDFSDIFNAARRFRYRTTLTLPRRESMAIRQFLMHYPLSALMSELPARTAPRATRRSPADFRRTVYRHNLWARPLPDFTGRFRDCSPDFFRYNDSQVHRLVPWLTRELFYLLNENDAHVTYVLGRVLELLPVHPILSGEFRTELRRFLGERTDHFLHEFHCFASTPYDLTGYDRHVQYQTDGRLSLPGEGASLVAEVLSSSDSESRDSDIVVVSSSHAAPGPSRASPPAPPAPAPAVVPIETISHSDSDSDSEVVVVGYIKPPHQRTPELVDLLASDSDVVLQEEEPPAPPTPGPAAAPAPSDQLVHIKLSVARPRSPSSSSSGARSHTPPLPRPPRRRRRARAPAPSSAAAPLVPRALDRPHSSSSSSSSSTSSPSPSPSSSSSSEEEYGPSSTGRARRPPRRKPRKKVARRKRSSARTSRRADATKKPAEADTRTKGKSRNGKDVKCSKLNETPSAALDRSEPAPPLDRAGPSGLADTRSRWPSVERPLAPYVPAPHAAAPPDARAFELAGPSRKRSVEGESRRGSHETRDSKRLKSVVKVMKREPSACTDSAEGRAGAPPLPRIKSSPDASAGAPPLPRIKSSPDASASAPPLPRIKSSPDASAGAPPLPRIKSSPDASAGAPPLPRIKSNRDASASAGAAPSSRADHDFSSSDDNIPLRRALFKPCILSRTYISDYSD